MTKNTATDQQLWQKFQQGDETAFQQIHQQHIGHLLNYGLRLSGTLSTVEDCIQDVFIEVWQYRNGLTQPVSIRFYLLKALRNRLRAQYRRDHPFVSGYEYGDEQEKQSLIPFDTEPSAED